jgi:hypothetical protein
MKPSKNDRHGCEIVRDFLLGLAVFLTVFTLAMLDSGTSHSAPAFYPKPATFSQSGAITLARVTTGTLILQAPEGEVTDYEAINVTLPRPNGPPLASDYFPAALPAMKNYGKAPGKNDTAEDSIYNARLAMNIDTLRAGRFAAPGTQKQSGRTWMLTVMALIFAAMTALTMCLWRHLRQSIAPQRTDRRV